MTTTERWRTWDAAWPEFPFRSRSLNGLVVSDVMIDLAEDLLGTDDVRMYLAIVIGQVRRPAVGLQPAPPHRLSQPHPDRAQGRRRATTRWRPSST